MKDAHATADTAAYESEYNRFMLGYLDELLPWVAEVAERAPLGERASPTLREELRTWLRRLDRWHDEHRPPPDTKWPATLPGNFTTPGEARPTAALQRLMDAEMQWRGRLTEVVDGEPVRALYGPLQPDDAA